MARLYLKRTSAGFEPADEPSRDTMQRFKRGDIFRADVVKPRSYQHHKLCLALLNLTWDNLPDRFENLWPTFDTFRYAIAEAAGHTREYATVDGEIKTMPASISYDAIPDDVEFGRVMAGMMTVCAKILDMAEPELAEEMQKYADSHFGRAA